MTVPEGHIGRTEERLRNAQRSGDPLAYIRALARAGQLNGAVDVQIKIKNKYRGWVRRHPWPKVRGSVLRPRKTMGSWWRILDRGGVGWTLNPATDRGTRAWHSKEYSLSFATLGELLDYLRSHLAAWREVVA